MFLMEVRSYKLIKTDPPPSNSDVSFSFVFILRWNNQVFNIF